MLSKERLIRVVAIERLSGILSNDLIKRKQDVFTKFRTIQSKNEETKIESNPDSHCRLKLAILGVKKLSSALRQINLKSQTFFELKSYANLSHALDILD